MIYNRLGRSGLRVSALSFGSWVTFGNQQGLADVISSMGAAHDAGCNFFDNAEVYAGGQAETLMGQAIDELGWSRESYVISTKLFWGITEGPNTKNTLNRKYLMQGIDGSLERLGLDFVDLLYCHRPDQDTPIEETVWAMHDIINRGQALYWGTSEWSADEIRAAYEIAERHHLHKPIVEQPQYNMFHRDRVEQEYARLFTDYGLGTTVFSPLASGLLTGKYYDGIPDDSRGALAGYDWLQSSLTDQVKVDKVAKLGEIAKGLGCTTAQLALAWCLTNPNISSVITGASRPSQVTENMAAIEVVNSLTEEVLDQIEDVLA